ncbi:hypothetical protein KC333_g45 [Hortaea werneckii]|nr:hypothetical protein KC333_g45 [Hortaea werneckii]
MVYIRLDCTELTDLVAARICSLFQPVASSGLLEYALMLNIGFRYTAGRMRMVKVFAGKAIDILKEVDHILIPVEEHVKRWISGHTPILHIVAARHHVEASDTARNPSVCTAGWHQRMRMSWFKSFHGIRISPVPSATSGDTCPDTCAMLFHDPLLVACIKKYIAYLYFVYQHACEGQMGAVTYQLKPKCRTLLDGVLGTIRGRQSPRNTTEVMLANLKDSVPSQKSDGPHHGTVPRRPASRGRVGHFCRDPSGRSLKIGLPVVMLKPPSKVYSIQNMARRRLRAKSCSSFDLALSRWRPRPRAILCAMPMKLNPVFGRSRFWR